MILFADRPEDLELEAEMEEQREKEEAEREKRSGQSGATQEKEELRRPCPV